jgi:hypothetical protein
MDSKRSLGNIMKQDNDNSEFGGDTMAMISLGASGAGKGKGAPPAMPGGLEPGRVILGAFDNGMVEHFKELVRGGDWRFCAQGLGQGVKVLV